MGCISTILGSLLILILVLGMTEDSLGFGETITGVIFVTVIWILCRLIANLFSPADKEAKEKERKEKIQAAKKENDTISIVIHSSDDEEKSNPADRFTNLNKQNFEHLRTAAYKLADFGLTVCAQSEVSAKLNVVMNLTDDKGSIDVTEKIKFTLFADAYRCYTYLDGKYDANKASSLALALFGNKVLIRSSHVDFVEIDHFLDNNSEICSNYYNRIYELTQKQGLFPNSIFFLEYVLEECKMNEERTKYLSLLYKFTSAIAAAFDLQNSKTRGWMSTLSTHMKGNSALVGSISPEQEEDPYKQLDSLIGLHRVKDEVNKLVSFIKVQQQREKNGMKTSALSHHFVFTGNPGTGKTTVARIIARIYEDLGIINGGQLVETDRSGLVAEYVGQTAVKTNNVIDKALDGVLFIDEAYSLANGSKEDFGHEAIATLLKRMEDDRDRLIVILAGYEDDMQNFIDSNPGLQSRFNRYVHFDDYSVDELMQIFLRSVEKHEYKLQEDAALSARKTIEEAKSQSLKNFGNARFVRNLFEKTIENQAIRLSKIDNPTAEQLSEITADDF